MLRALICFLTGEHEYMVTCEPGTIFLECRHCAHRSSGWDLRREQERRRAQARKGQLVPVAVDARRRRS
jgi:hypothetical protein